MVLAGMIIIGVLIQTSFYQGITLADAGFCVIVLATVLLALSTRSG